jgi:Flp pilus assembly secretin CpaC
MLCLSPLRGPQRKTFLGPLLARGCVVMALGWAAAARAQDPSNSPVSVPAGALKTQPAVQPEPPAAAPRPQVHISAKQAREADDAYLDGAKQVQRKNLPSAIKDFERAVQLNPADRDYVLALLVARESRVTELVQAAAKARLRGDPAQADALLGQARVLDPANQAVAQHFGPAPNEGPVEAPAAGLSSTLAGPIELDPAKTTKTFHLNGDAQTVVRGVYSAFGINVVFDSSFTASSYIPFELKDASFADATRVLAMMTHCLAVPVQPKLVLIAKDTQENRDALMPLVEETVYLPGLTQDQMTELANLARNVFDVKQVTASATGGYMLLRGDENVLNQVNAVYADMLDGGSEVQFDVTVYEIDSAFTRDIGATLPNSFTGFSLLSAAQNLISANQSLINEAVSVGQLVLTGSQSYQELLELAFLVAAGVSGSSQFTSILGALGTDGGLPLFGVSEVSGTTFNAMLSSTDVRTIDALTLRSGNHQVASFRAGTRYPVVTATYSTGSTSSLAAAAAAAGVSSATISQYLGSGTSTTVPQFQFEDLGITLKMTPQILHSSEISLALDMKIEALAGGTINSIPILNNRALTSTVNVPAGKTVMLAALLDTDETKALTGIPGLNDLPGFQGSEQDTEKDSTELLITITPHIVRTGSLHVTGKRLAAVRTTAGGGFNINQ